MDRELKLFSTQIETWGSPLLIRAFDENHAEGLTRILFKVPSEVGITATTEEEEINGQNTTMFRLSQIRQSRGLRATEE